MSNIYLFDYTEKLNFGLYKGHDIRLVYMIDQEYLEWCLRTINFFAIRGIENLSEIHQIQKERNYAERENKIEHPIFHFFSDYHHFVSSVQINLEKKEYQTNDAYKLDPDDVHQEITLIIPFSITQGFSEEIIRLNNQKLDIIDSAQ